MHDTHDLPDLFDLTILGGGPTGLFAAFYAGLRGMKTKIIDSLDHLGGQLTALYPEKKIFDIPGFPEITARALADNLIHQAMQHSPTLCLGELAHSLDTVAPLHYRLTTNHAVHDTRSLLIAAGTGAFAPRKLQLPEAAPLEGHCVFYSVASKAQFAGKKLLIIGGGHSAIDWALQLLDTAASVTLIHRRDTFRAHESTLRQLQSSPATMLPFWELGALITANGTLTGAILHHAQTGKIRPLPVDAVLVQIGYQSSLGPLQHWPLKIEHGAIAVDSHMQTPLQGVFAAGDIATYPGKLKLLATAFSEAATAVNYAKALLDPTARPFPGHSSELIPQPETMAKLK
jgi:thioredoxin reductase (NADPH)